MCILTFMPCPIDFDCKCIAQFLFLQTEEQVEIILCGKVVFKPEHSFSPGVSSEAELICVFSYSKVVLLYCLSVKQRQSSGSQTDNTTESVRSLYDLKLKSRHNFNQYATELISLIEFVTSIWYQHKYPLNKVLDMHLYPKHKSSLVIHFKAKIMHLSEHYKDWLYEWYVETLKAITNVVEVMYNPKVWESDISSQV